MFLSTLFGTKARRTRTQRPRSFRLERLEDRTTPTAGFADDTFGNLGIVSSNFGTAGARNDGAEAVVVQPDGKTVVAGFAQLGTTNHDFLIARYNRDGTPDTSFDTDGFRFVAFDLGGTIDDRARAIALQPDGKIVVAGFVTRTTGTDFAICRLNADGSLDTTFDTDGRQTVAFDLGGTLIDVANDLVVQPDGKILLAGSATISGTDTDFAVCRLNANGSLDTSFDTDGKETVALNLGGNDADTAEGIALAPGGEIVLAGTASFNSTLSEVAVVRLTSVGALDATFAGGAGLTTLRYTNILGRNTGKDVAVQPDGKIVVTGVADRGNADTDFGVARLTADGFLDPTFDGDGRVAKGLSQTGTRNDQPEALLLQPDGKIVVAGFSNVDIGSGVSNDLFVTRLLPTGQNDSLYNNSGLLFYDLTAGGNNNDEARAVALGADGIVVAGIRDTAGADGTDVAVLRAVRDDWIVVGQASGAPTVRILTPLGTELFRFDAFPATFKGGVRVAAVDVNGDDTPEIFCAPGPGLAPVVRIFDGFTFELIREIPVLTPAFRAGVFLSVGDVLAGSTAAPELLVSPGPGTVGRVEIYDPTVVAAPIKTIVAYTNAFRGGVVVTTANVDATGKRELVIGRVSGGGLIRVLNAGDATPGSETLVRQFLAFPAAYRGGVSLSSGDVNGDGRDEVIVSASSGVPFVKVFDLTKAASDPAFLRKQYKPFAGTFRAGGQVTAFRLGGSVKFFLPGRKGGIAPPTVKGIEAETGTPLSEFLPLGLTLKTNVFLFGVNRG